MLITNWAASSGIDTYDPQHCHLLRGLRTKVALHRFGTQAELSSAVVHRLSEASGFTSGNGVIRDLAMSRPMRAPQVPRGMLATMRITILVALPQTT